METESLPWYRVEFSTSGKVLVCEICEGPTLEGRSVVVYVQAIDPDAAKEKGYKMRQQGLQRERRQRYRDQGLCHYCGRELSTDSKIRCRVCTERQREYRSSKVYRVAEKVERRSPAERQRERRQTLEQVERLSVLLEVKTAYERCLRRDLSFLDWLTESVAEARNPKKSEAA